MGVERNSNVGVATEGGEGVGVARCGEGVCLRGRGEGVAEFLERFIFTRRDGPEEEVAGTEGGALAVKGSPNKRS